MTDQSEKEPKMILVDAVKRYLETTEYAAKVRHYSDDANMAYNELQRIVELILK